MSVEEATDKENMIPAENVADKDSADTKVASAADQNTNSIPQELFVKHPLQYKWTLWYCKADRAKQWEDCLKQVTSFDTVEDFWSLYNHIQLASGLSWGSDYYLFKEGIKPMWEDPQNINGGRWLIQVDKMQRNTVLDSYWLELLMAVIGEQFEDMGDQICGAVVNVRTKGDKISLWTRDCNNYDQLKKMGQILKQKLNIPDQICFEAHQETKHKTSSTVKSVLKI